MLFGVAFPFFVSWVIWLAVVLHGGHHGVTLRPPFQRTCCKDTDDWQPSVATPSDPLYHSHQAVPSLWPAQWVCPNLAIAAWRGTPVMSSQVFSDSPLAWMRPIYNCIRVWDPSFPFLLSFLLVWSFSLLFLLSPSSSSTGISSSKSLAFYFFCGVLLEDLS